MTDLDGERVAKGLGVRARPGRRAAGRKGASPRTGANRLKALVTGSTDTAVFADADLVLEAVFEELAVKQKVFAELEAVVRPDCVLATNTSSLSVTAMAADLTHPERVVGLHFFNPVAVLPLVEVVRGRPDRRRDARHRVRGRQGAEEVLRAGAGRTGVRVQPAGHARARRGDRGDRRRDAVRGRRRRRRRRSACRCRRSCCCSWSVRRSPCTPPGRCTRRSRTGSAARPGSRRSWRRASAASTPGWTARLLVDPEVAALWPQGDVAAHGRAGARPRRGTRSRRRSG